MRAYKCDRCGEYFDEVKDRKIVTIEKVNENGCCFNIDKLDICPSCYEQFIEFTQNY